MSKVVTGECENCESSFELAYAEELVSDSTPNFCPFCGEKIDNVIEDEYINDDELDDDEQEWN